MTQDGGDRVNAAEQPQNDDLLAGWAERQLLGSRRRARPRKQPRVGVRFAFYGRISTEDFQDRQSSQRWQRAIAEDVVADHGTIVAEFFDVGYSRRLPWADQPQAAALLAALTDRGRGFHAVVVGEFERAFYGDQFTAIAPIFERHGVQLWLPEIDGPVDHHNPTHEALLMLLGVQSKREVLRARHRVLAAMRAQAIEQGRHLGGRPPYGYRLVDAGPHPNRAHARWGRRLHRLEPDPATAPHVAWIFAQRLAGNSVASIARDLNERGVPCPSRVDPGRNPHRSGQAWTLRTVAAILSNPRYTGRQVLEPATHRPP
jgi:site-specific DNA recombinase